MTKYAEQLQGYAQQPCNCLHQWNPIGESFTVCRCYRCGMIRISNMRGNVCNYSIGGKKCLPDGELIGDE